MRPLRHEVLLLDGPEPLPHDGLRHPRASPQLTGPTRQGDQSRFESVGDDLDGVSGQIPQGLGAGLGTAPEEAGAQATTRLERSHRGQRTTGGGQGEPASGGRPLAPGTRIDLGPHARHRRGEKGLSGGLELSGGVILGVDIISQANEVLPQTRPRAVPGATH